MEDMKRMIERYKQELMDYRRTAQPKATLEFPEMIQDEQEDAVQTLPSDKEDGEPAYTPENGFTYYPEQTPRKPEIIGYVDGKGTDFDHVFEEMTKRAMPQDIPSMGEVREDITENSSPEDNVPYVDEVSGVTDNSATEPLPDTSQGQTVSEETVERLTDQPVSGTDPDEQLGRKSFEDESTPERDREDIAPINPDGNVMREYPPHDYKSYEDFTGGSNTRWGSLRFRTYTARGALPVGNATVEISVQVDGKPYILYTLTTDNSGQTKPVSLPAPSAELSQKPDSEIRPYALYNAVVKANGFTTVELKDIPVFDGVASIQRVAMVPSSSPSGVVVDENEPDL